MNGASRFRMRNTQSCKKRKKTEKASPVSHQETGDAFFQNILQAAERIAVHYSFGLPSRSILSSVS